MVEREALRAIAIALGAGEAVSVPREWLLELLDGANVPSKASPDLTVAEVAERFGRAPSTVRSWILSGQLRAYRFRGRELRVPYAALEAFEAGQRCSEGPQVTPTRSSRTSVDLTAYQRAS